MALNYPLDTEDRIGQAVVQMQLLDENDQVVEDRFFTDFDNEGDTNTIRIYIPGGISIPDNVSYGDTNLGLVGQLLMSGIDDVGAAVSRAGSALNLDGFQMEGSPSTPQLGTSFDIDANAAGSIATYAILGVTAGLASTAGGLLGTAGAAIGLTNAAIPGAIGLSTKRVLNPNTKATFQGVGLRKFGFTFNMIPKSKTEADIISQIIRKLRIHMYPSETGTSDQYSVYLKYPKKVRLTIMTSADEDDNINHIRFKDCFITSVNRSLNPTSNLFHRDGHPTEVALSIQFSEDSILSSQDVVEGF